jgi:hypothetical protein
MTHTPQPKTLAEHEARANAGRRMIQTEAARDIGPDLAAIRATGCREDFEQACRRVRDFASRNFPQPKP